MKMANRFNSFTIITAIVCLAIGVAVGLVMTRPTGAAASSRPARTADGRPNFSGIWQANNTANWDLEAHAAKAGPLPSLGAAFSIPPGLGVVDGDGTIPYLPEALAKKQANAANWMTLDPEV